MATRVATKSINFKWKIFLLICFWTMSANLVSNAVQSHSQICLNVNCPPMAKTNCPEDSYIREDIFNELGLSEEEQEHHDEIDESIFRKCCLTKKCTCRVCHIPSCHNNSLVLMETIPETEIPGMCCGQYKCIFEPNCTETINSNGHWLADCQRCECVSGERMCHRSCDEVLLPPRNCISQNLNRFFENGDVWQEDDCTHCECHYGKKKCQTSFCRQLNCGARKIIKIPGECCPLCEHNDNDIIAVSTTLIKPFEKPTEQVPNVFISTSTLQEETTPPLTTIKKVDINETTLATTAKQILTIEITTATPAKKPTLPYSLESLDTVKVMQPPPVPQYCVFYIVITILSLLLVLFIGLYCHERTKQRSYDPVPSIDNNFNKIPIKIKPIECA